MTERKDHSYAYEEHLVEQVRQLLKDKITTSPTTAARMMLRDNDLDYTEEIGRWYRKKFQQDTKLVNTVSYKKAQDRVLPKSKVYFISSAQNSTPIQENLLRNMEVHAKYIGAEIAVIASRYRNPTLFDEGLKNNYWEKSIEKYLIASRYRLHKNLILASDIRINYTTRVPLNVLEKLKGGVSYIGGHPRQDMRSIPVLDGAHGKYLYSTGSLTLPINYSDTATGSVALENHKMGFLVVEVLDEDNFTVTNVEADEEGNYIDRNIVLSNGVLTEEDNTVEVMVVGDSHIGFSDRNATMATSLMIGDLNPKKVVLHDVLSAESVHYYNRIDIFKQLELRNKGMHLLSHEIELSMNYIKAMSEIVEEVIIPSANHHDIVDRWLSSGDWKKDPDNARIYLELATLKADPEVDTSKGVFASLVDNRFYNKNVKTLSYDESYRVLGKELGQHGNIGLNGARGSANAYDKTGIDHIVAHGHSPYKYGGILCVGTNSKSRMGYNKGYSGWKALNGIITRNGKVQYLQILK